MSETLKDKIRGMLLLGAYGDALGAIHEGSREVAEPPFPKKLPVRRMPRVGFAWSTWLPNSVIPAKAGVPTDDTCYRLFILHPWLQEIADGNSSFDESSFRKFMLKLKKRSIEAEWANAPRNGQIDAWLDMFQAEEEGRCSFTFFCPDEPIVFGLFMYLETGTIVTCKSPEETYVFFKRFARLDQRYASSASAFMITMLSMAIEHDYDVDKFSNWFFKQSLTLLEQLRLAFPNDSDLGILENLFSKMRTLGADNRGRPEEVFASSFKRHVIDPEYPPFMDERFSGVFDPFRFIAQIVSTVEFSNGDPAIALRSIAYSIGDTDTTASFLGSLMGAWYGERHLRNFKTPGLNLDAELDIIEDCLVNQFKIDLDQRVRIFENLRIQELFRHI